MYINIVISGCCKAEFSLYNTLLLLASSFSPVLTLHALVNRCDLATLSVMSERLMVFILRRSRSRLLDERCC